MNTWHTLLYDKNEIRQEMETIGSNAPDIINFEKKFRELIYEVQRSTRELDNFEKERSLIREELYSKELLLQNERKVASDLRARLKMACETLNQLEEEKMRDKLEYSNLSTNYESILNECEILTNEASSHRTEITKLKIKSENLENALEKETRQREKLENALMDLKKDNEEIIANINMSIIKISKEQNYLLHSAKGIIQLNRRLQTFGLCAHAINERNKAEIKNLQQKVISLSVNESKKSLSNDRIHPEIETLLLKLKEMLITVKTRLQDPAPFEEKLNRIFSQLSTNNTNTITNGK